MEWMLLPLRRYAEFTGRSRRMEYWMFQLLNVLVIMAFFLVMLAGFPFDLLTLSEVPGGPDTQPGVLFWVGLGLVCIWGLATFIPGIAVTIRRLHDRDMSGWWYLGFIGISIIPLVGSFAWIAWLVIMCLPGNRGENRFGADPLGQEAEVFA